MPDFPDDLDQLIAELLAPLANNENPWGPPESVMQAMNGAFKYANRYGYPDGNIVEEIAKHPAHKIRPQTWAFVDAWTAFAKDNRTRLLSNGKAEKLIVEREWELKDKYARLIEPEARKTWSGASAYAPLDYRWRRLTQFVFKDLCGGA